MSICKLLSDILRLTLWQRAKLSTTSCTRDDISRRPLLAICTPVAIDGFLPCPESKCKYSHENHQLIDGFQFTCLSRCSKSHGKLMRHFVHRIKPIRHRAHMQLLHFHLWAMARIFRSRESKILNVAPFCVSVPVLSLNRYSIRPSSSGSVLVRTIVLGISVSVMICCAYTVLPISRLTRRLYTCKCKSIPRENDLHIPDGYNGRKQD